MKRNFLRILLVILTVTAVGCTSAPATVVPISAKPQMYDTLDDMISRSTTVVTGEVVNVLPARKHEKSPVPITEAIFRIDQVLKGEVKTPTIKVYQLGGRVGDMDYQIENLRYYQKGERLVLFLEYAMDDLYTAISFVQGEHRLAESGKVKFQGKAKSEEVTVPELKERAGKVPDRSRKAPNS